MNILTTADEPALAELCEAFAEMVAARASLANPVEVQDGEGGYVTVAQAGELTYAARSREGWTIRARPEMAMIETASRRFHALLGQFGMTPAARSNINLAEPAKPGPDDAYF